MNNKKRWFIASIISTFFYTAFADVAIPYGNSIYLYPSNYLNANSPTDAQTAVNRWIQQVNTFNQAAKGDNKLSTLYPYASDVEFVCSHDFVTQGENLCQAVFRYKDKKTNTIVTAQGMGYFYGEKGESADKKPLPTDDYIAQYLAKTCLAGKDCSSSSSGGALNMVGIVDGRIDNGYLQNFDDQSVENLQKLAKLIAHGGAIFDTTKGASGIVTVGICASKLNGVQVDIEPFADSAAQAVFYNQLASDLNACGKYYSVFTFAEKITQDAVNALSDNGKYHNFYVVDSLYDLPYDNNAPVMKDGTYCTPANKGKNGCTNTVPTPLPTYENYVAAEVKAMLAAAKKYNIAFKFAIPAAASAHEFESWNAVKAGKIGAQIGKGTATQLQYTTAAINAIKAGFKSLNADDLNKVVCSKNALFKGIDVWGDSPSAVAGTPDQMVWSPTPAVKDWMEGGDIPGSGEHYVAFYPGSVSSNVMTYLQTNLDVKSGICK